MREVNFSIPNVNKASVGITTALYDRRALDCTSTLPLIHSLNHLAYLTTSSARIREILTVDGGVERLVCILKEGRDREVMEMWKWNLAFQCLVNIGVRGSEHVRTRVVEAEMVPVIATLLDNYIQIIDKLKEKSESCGERRHVSRHNASTRTTSHTKRSTSAHSSSTRQPPPAIAIPPPPPSPSRMRSRTHDQHDPHHHLPHHLLHHQMPPSPRGATGSRQTRHQHARSDGSAAPARSGDLPTINTQLIAEGAADLSLRPVRDVDRLPSMDPNAINGSASQPESPTTPMAPVLPTATTTTRERRRPALRQQMSASTDLEDGDADQSPAEMDQEPSAQEGEPMVDIQTADNMDDAAPTEVMLDTVAQQMDLTAAAGSEAADAEVFPMPHVPGQDGSIIATNMRPPAATMGTNLPPTPSPLAAASATSSSSSSSANTHGRFTLSHDTHPSVQAAMPRDEDVLMSLQLLAYVSKYCNLRTYFQNSHLVPKLKLGSKADLFDAETSDVPRIEELAEVECNEEEYLLPDDVNIFPLVEKFTVRHHPNEMQYWAGVVMRNLCRKDDSRGGIRQCAYYRCAKWEEYPRQFAKCRRCRRTKYCSKECQKNAWVYHRHWCMVADGSR